jgi:RNA polymerase sigma factor (sigma-70 family)
MPEKPIYYGAVPDLSACKDPFPADAVKRVADLDWTRLRLIAAKIVRDGPTSVDIVDAARMRLLERTRHDTEPVKSLQAFADVAVRNAALNWVERQKREMSLEDSQEIPDQRDDPAVKFDGMEILRLVKRLPANQRIPFLLSHVYGMDDEEVAAKMDISPAAVRKRIQRAYQFLRSVVSDLSRPK